MLPWNLQDKLIKVFAGEGMSDLDQYGLPADFAYNTWKRESTSRWLVWRLVDRGINHFSNVKFRRSAELDAAGMKMSYHWVACGLSYKDSYFTGSTRYLWEICRTRTCLYPSDTRWGGEIELSSEVCSNHQKELLSSINQLWFWVFQLGRFEEMLDFPNLVFELP